MFDRVVVGALYGLVWVAYAHLGHRLWFGAYVIHFDLGVPKTECCHRTACVGVCSNPSACCGKLW
jgi:hypothetical protein